jgi:hypothetical protein
VESPSKRERGDFLKGEGRREETKDRGEKEKKEEKIESPSFSLLSLTRALTVRHADLCNVPQSSSQRYPEQLYLANFKNSYS